MNIFEENLIDWDSLPDAECEPYDWNILGDEPKHHILSDMNSLYEAMRRARKGTDWKEGVIGYTNRYLPKLTDLQSRLEDGTYRPKTGIEFFLNERGRMRAITGQCVEDRIVSHSLNDNILIPSIRSYLIYDNTASLKGRGVDMARRRIAVHLKRYYQREGTNVGYIRLKDQSKYYDNILHDKLYDQVLEFTQDEMALWIVRMQLDESAIDVSYMSDDEFEYAMTHKFDRLAYRNEGHPKENKRFLPKGMNVGDQFSQTAGIMYPYKVDQLAKTVLGSKYYARYMDDSYDIDRDIWKLRERAELIDAEADKIGMFTNERKTQICRIDKGFVYMQRLIKLHSDGSVTMRVLPNAVTRIKRRIRKLKKKDVPVIEVVNMVKSWIGGRKSELGYMQIRTIEKLILEVYGEEVYEQVYYFNVGRKVPDKPCDEREYVCQPGGDNKGRTERERNEPGSRPGRR